MPISLSTSGAFPRSAGPSGGRGRPGRARTRAACRWRPRTRKTLLEPPRPGGPCRMRRTLLSLVPALAAGLALVGCVPNGNADPGAQTTQDRAVSAVSAVELRTSGDLTLSTGDAPSLRISAGRNVIDHLSSEVGDDRLTLATDGTPLDLGRVRYELVLPAARHLEVAGSGDARAASPSALGDVVLSGSGDLRIEGLTTEELGVE